MNYTTNYHLPQWAETDRIQMEDFNQAMADIDQGLSDAYRPSNLPYFIGSYTGNGDTQEVVVGFRPSFLIIGASQSTGTQYSDETSMRHCAIIDGGPDRLYGRVTLTDTGFTVSVNANDVYSYHELNADRYKYRYLAFQ